MMRKDGRGESDHVENVDKNQRFWQRTFWRQGNITEAIFRQRLVSNEDGGINEWQEEWDMHLDRMICPGFEEIMSKKEEH